MSTGEVHGHRDGMVLAVLARRSGHGYAVVQELRRSGDGVLDLTDNCKTTANPNQKNDDGDAFGNACDADLDNDGVPNTTDNCVDTANPDQADADKDGIGDVCDPKPNEVDPGETLQGSSGCGLGRGTDAGALGASLLAAVGWLILRSSRRGRPRR